LSKATGEGLMQRIPLVDAKPDMALASDLFNDQQMLLLKKGVVLNTKNIKMLKSWGVALIEIESELDLPVERPESDRIVQRSAVEARMKKKFCQWDQSEVMHEIRRVATEIIMHRFHRQDVKDAD
jgi:hypothetical protein